VTSGEAASVARKPSKLPASAWQSRGAIWWQKAAHWTSFSEQQSHAVTMTKVALKWLRYTNS